VIPKSWHSYRRLNRIAVWLLVAGFPFVVVLAVGAKILLGASSEFFFISVVVLWCVAWGYAAIRVSRCLTMRCSEPGMSVVVAIVASRAPGR
jgi:hypothetical protein